MFEITLKLAFLEDEKSFVLRSGRQAVLSERIIRELWEDHAEADKNLFK